MIGVRGRLNVYAYCRPTDMRKGFESLAAIVRNELEQDPLSGSVFVFTNKRRHLAKVLYFDGTGFCLLSKRLERGRFAALWEHARHETIRLSRSELDLFLRGSALIGRYVVHPPDLDEKELVVRR